MPQAEYDERMLASAALALVTLAAGHPIPQESWVEQDQSFGEVDAFRVRADLHTADKAAAATLKADIEKQVEAALRGCGIKVTDAPRPATPHVDGIAELILDVHLVKAQESTAVAWSLHVSQMVRLATGPWAFAATWIVGDLIQGPTSTVGQRLHDNLQPALDEFCAAHSAARAPRPHGNRGPSGTRL
jgi:hypothetical protein